MAFPRIEIRTNRLLLRPWRLTDIDDAFEYGSDPEWSRYLWNTPSPYTREHAEAFVRLAAEDDWSRQAMWAMELDGKVVGGIRLYITDKAAGVAGLGYNLGRAHWGQGLGTEGAAAVLAYAFEGAGLHKVFSTADARNIASIRVMHKLGMAWEGSLREQRLHRGEYVDEVHYGLLEQEWRAQRA